MASKAKMNYGFFIAIVTLLLIAIGLYTYFGHTSESFVASNNEYMAFYQRVGAQLPAEIGQLIQTSGYPAAAFSRMPNFRNEFFARYPGQIVNIATGLDYPNVLVDLVTANPNIYRPFLTATDPVSLAGLANFQRKFPMQFNQIRNALMIPTNTGASVPQTGPVLSMAAAQQGVPLVQQVAPMAPQVAPMAPQYAPPMAPQLAPMATQFAPKA